MQIKLVDGTTYNALYVCEEAGCVQRQNGIIPYLAIQITDDCTVDSLITAFTETNLAVITATTDDGEEKTVSGYLYAYKFSKSVNDGYTTVLCTKTQLTKTA